MLAGKINRYFFFIPSVDINIRVTRNLLRSLEMKEARGPVNKLMF